MTAPRRWREDPACPADLVSTYVDDPDRDDGEGGGGYRIDPEPDPERWSP